MNLVKTNFIALKTNLIALDGQGWQQVEVLAPPNRVRDHGVVLVVAVVAARCRGTGVVDHEERLRKPTHLRE